MQTFTYYANAYYTFLAPLTSHTHTHSNPCNHTLNNSHPSLPPSLLLSLPLTYLCLLKVSVLTDQQILLPADFREFVLYGQQLTLQTDRETDKLSSAVILELIQERRKASR